jgi:hypothetical protein
LEGYGKMKTHISFSFKWVRLINKL